MNKHVVIDWKLGIFPQLCCMQQDIVH